MKLIYIAGAYRAATPWWVEQNIRKAEEAMINVWKLGAAGVCPHSMGRFMDKEIADAVALAGTLALLQRCDAIFMVPNNWQMSRGAIAERQMAMAWKMPVFYTLDELKEWLEVPK